VVAQEVKELSKQTEQATQDVSRKISLIREETGIIMDSIGTIDGKIENLTQISIDVNAAVKSQQRFTRDIASMTASTSEETRDVSQCITQVEKAAVSTLELSGTVHEHSESISQSMVHLLDETTRRLQSLGSDRAA
jgi:methyl-accepting chemotaxis protein